MGDITRPHQAFEPDAGVECANGASALTGTLELLQKLHFFFRQNHFVSFVSDIGLQGVTDSRHPVAPPAAIEVGALWRIESVHPLHGPELRALRPLQGAGPYVFVTEAGTPTTTAWFLRMVQRVGQAAKLPFPVHPHMLRHSTGYKLANEGHDTRSLAHYLGHRNLQSTARHTALAEGRFAKFWQD
jgi:Phage integrase family